MDQEKLREPIFYESAYFALYPDAKVAVSRNEFTCGREHWDLKGRSRRLTATWVIPAGIDEQAYFLHYPAAKRFIERKTDPEVDCAAAHFRRYGNRMGLFFFWKNSPDEISQTTPAEDEPEPVRETSTEIPLPGPLRSVRLVSQSIGADAPKISVVVPFFNCERYIEKCVSSLLYQIFRDFEIILVDDGSTDESQRRAVALLLQGNVQYTVVEKPNGGTGSALNLGFQYARGEYQTWWSADSWVKPEWLTVLSAALDENPDVGFVYSNWIQYDQITDLEYPMQAGEPDPERLHYICYVGVCWLWRRPIKEVAGEFILAPCEDYDMHLRMIALTKFQKVPKFLGYWRNHSENMTTSVCKENGWADGQRIKYRHNWNKGKLRVANVSPWWDAASVGWLQSDCLNMISSRVASRHILGEPTGMRQTEDLTYRDVDELTRVIDECDVLHLNLVPPEWEKNRIDVLPWIKKGKPTLWHLHGGPWQWKAWRVKELISQFPNVIICSCNPAIDELLPGAIWMPNPLPLGPEPQLWEQHYYLPSPGWPNTTHFPTRYLFGHNYKAGKGGDALQDAVDSASSGRLPFDVVIRNGEPLPLRQFLEYKKNFDGVIDQITQGFIGMAGWESLAQGAVVFARLDERAVELYTLLGQGTPPPIENCRGIDHLMNRLRDFSEDAGRLRETREASRAWMLEHYSAARICRIWEDLYENVANVRTPSTLELIHA